MSRSNGLRAFSLVETLIAIGVSMILLAGVIYFAAQKARELRTQDLIQRTEERRDILSKRMREDLMQVVRIGSDKKEADIEVGMDISGVVPVCVGNFSTCGSGEPPTGVFLVRYLNPNDYVMANTQEARAFAGSGELVISGSRVFGQAHSTFVTGDEVIVETGGINQLYTMSNGIADDGVNSRLTLGQSEFATMNTLNELRKYITDANVRVYRVEQVVYAWNPATLEVFRFKRGDYTVSNISLSEPMMIQVKNTLDINTRRVATDVEKMGFQFFPCSRSGVSMSPMSYDGRQWLGLREMDSACYSLSNGGVKYRKIAAVSVGLVMVNPAKSRVPDARTADRDTRLIATYFSVYPTRYGGGFFSEMRPPVVMSPENVTCSPAPTPNCAAVEMGLCPEQEGDPGIRDICSCWRIREGRSSDLDKDKQTCCGGDKICSIECAEALWSVGDSVCTYNDHAGACCPATCNDREEKCKNCSTLTNKEKCETCGAVDLPELATAIGTACCEAFGSCDYRCSADVRCEPGGCDQKEVLCNTCRETLDSESLNDACCSSENSADRCNKAKCNLFCKPGTAGSTTGCPDRYTYCWYPLTEADASSCAYDWKQNCANSDCLGLNTWTSGNVRYCQFCKDTAGYNADRCCSVHTAASCDTLCKDAEVKTVDTGLCTTTCGKCDPACYGPGKPNGSASQLCDICPYLRYHKDVPVVDEGGNSTTIGELCQDKIPCEMSDPNGDISLLCDRPVLGAASETSTGCLMGYHGLDFQTAMKKVCDGCPVGSTGKEACCWIETPANSPPEYPSSYTKCYPGCPDPTIQCYCRNTPESRNCSNPSITWDTYGGLCSGTDAQKKLWFCSACPQRPECDLCSDTSMLEVVRQSYHDQYYAIVPTENGGREKIALPEVAEAMYSKHLCVNCNMGCCTAASDPTPFLDAKAPNLFFDMCNRCTPESPDFESKSDACTQCVDSSYYCTDAGWNECGLGSTDLNQNYSGIGNGYQVWAQGYYRYTIRAQCECFLKYRDQEGYGESQDLGLDACCKLLSIATRTEAMRLAPVICPFAASCPEDIQQNGAFIQHCNCFTGNENDRKCNPTCNAKASELCECALNYDSYITNGIYIGPSVVPPGGICMYCCDESVVSLDDYVNKYKCGLWQHSNCSSNTEGGG